jgi:LmbE family N-acetylglucosaminyl deacetylase
MSARKKSKAKKTKTVLATGAHFDDVDVGVGGTLLKHVAKGHDVYIAIMESDEFRTGDPKIRVKEQLAAMKVLGVDESRLLLFTSTDDPPDIISVLDGVKPDIVYTPYHKDTHQAHRRCSKIAQSVGRKKNITTMFYYCGSSVEFYPNVFSIINFSKKMELIKCHKTQIDCGALKRTIREKMESYWAALVSLEEDSYAEGLMVRKMIYEV